MDDTNALFVYGTLLDEDVFSAVLGRAPPTVPAVLAGFRRHPVAHTAYPAIVVDADHTVSGHLVHDLSATELRRLDGFEGGDYQRVVVTVTTSDGRQHPANVYVWRADPARLVDATWSFDDFLRSAERQHFLGAIRG